MLYIRIVLVPAARLRLEMIAKETNRRVEDLAADAVEEVALSLFRHRNDDPAK